MLSQGMYYVKVTKTCSLTLFLKSQFTCVNSILKRSVSMKQISLGTEAKNLDTDRLKFRPVLY